MVTSVSVVLYSLQGAFTFIISFDPQFLKQRLGMKLISRAHSWQEGGSGFKPQHPRTAKEMLVRAWACPFRL